MTSQEGGGLEAEAGPSTPGATKETADGADGEVPPSLDENRCDLVWEGPIRERAFAVFRPKATPTDNAAREVLGQKLASYWDMAKNFKPEDEQLGL